MWPSARSHLAKAAQAFPFVNSALVTSETGNLLRKTALAHRQPLWKMRIVGSWVHYIFERTLAGLPSDRLRPSRERPVAMQSGLCGNGTLLS